MQRQILIRRVRWLLAAFTLGLLVSGLTAFPLPWETSILEGLVGQGTAIGDAWPAMAEWVSRVHRSLAQVDREQPFLLYGTDWLAFAHVVLAVLFVGAIKDPVKNVWVVQFGMIACAMVIPLAMICGPIRGIPFFWRVIDCMFGVVGFVPLWISYGYIRRVSGSLPG